MAHIICPQRVSHLRLLSRLRRDMVFLKKVEILGGTQLRFFCHNMFACRIISQIIFNNKKTTHNKILNIGNFNTNIINLSKKILQLTKLKKVNIHHETNTIDKRSYEVSVHTSKNLNKKLNFKKLTDKSILETFKKIQKDKKPFSQNKITLSVYKNFLNKKYS